MIGKYDIEIYNNRTHFRLQVKRNITIIQGDSATGKSTLIGMLSDYGRLSEGSGITLKCEKPCVVLPAVDWQNFIEGRSEHIIFVEENMPFISSGEFAETVNGSDNYFVIIYRDSLPQLSYSVEEIYGFHTDRESQKYVNAKRVYNSMYQLYNLHEEERVEADLVITEDSNAGYEFFSEALPSLCIAAGGKTKVATCVEAEAKAGQTVLSIVDGAAFGADIQRFMNAVRDRDYRCVLYAPESFEYLILRAGIIEVSRDILEHPYQYVDSKLYVSWERFFTRILTEGAQNTIYQYSKTKLNPAFLTEGNKEKILHIMPEMVR